MSVKQTAASKAKATSKAKNQSSKKATHKPADNKVSSLKDNTSIVSGWVQDVSLEAPVPVAGLTLKEGDREVEFSIGVRRHQQAGTLVSELRARALIHTGGTVLALAEVSYMAETKADAEESAVVNAMYAQLRPVLQNVLKMAGHTPPLPEKLQSSAV